MSNYAEEMQDKDQKEFNESKIVLRALAVAYVADCLEKHADEMTTEEQLNATRVSLDACAIMQDKGIQITGFDLFTAALKILEN